LVGSDDSDIAGFMEWIRLIRSPLLGRAPQIHIMAEKRRENDRWQQSHAIIELKDWSLFSASLEANHCRSRCPVAI